MKTVLALMILMLPPGYGRAQDSQADKLRKAIVEEESNQNLDKAIQEYQSILSRFDEERKTAAAAVFHLAECYRKQGKKEQAIAAYERVVREFSDQQKMAEASRSQLSKTFGIVPEPGRLDLAIREREAQRQAELQEVEFRQQARQQYRMLLQQELALAEQHLVDVQKRFEAGTVSADYLSTAKMELIQLRQKLAAFDAGILQPPK